MVLIFGGSIYDFVNLNFPVFCEVVIKFRLILPTVGLLRRRNDKLFLRDFFDAQWRINSRPIGCETLPEAVPFTDSYFSEAIIRHRISY
jgi:hypothetical protein